MGLIETRILLGLPQLFFLLSVLPLHFFFRINALTLQSTVLHIAVIPALGYFSNQGKVLINKCKDCKPLRL